MVPLPRRLFIGLLPGRQIQAAIQRHCRDWQWPQDVQTTRFGRYHLTLHPLGMVGLAPEQRLRKALRDVAVEPLELELRRPQGWRNHVAVLLPAEHDGLRALHRRLGHAVSAAGLEPTPEKHFKPHVTLAHAAAGAPPPHSTQPIRWRVDEFVLIWSLWWPQVTPSRYEVVERFGVTPGRQMEPLAASGNAGEQFPLFG